MISSPPLHIVSDRLGRWQVQREGEDQPLSDHESATDAERAAVRQADRSGASEVLVHDRYERVHRAQRRVT
jgi:D-aminopeptidase